MNLKKTIEYKEAKMGKQASVYSFSSINIEKIIQDGEEDIKNGKIVDAREVFEEMRKKYGY